MNTVRIFTDDIKMKFGISECATRDMKRGMKVKMMEYKCQVRWLKEIWVIELANIVEY